jgi:hypothetical protein
MRKKQKYLNLYLEIAFPENNISLGFALVSLTFIPRDDQSRKAN